MGAGKSSFCKSICNDEYNDFKISADAKACTTTGIFKCVTWK